jgi:hypothetical protein
MPPRLRIHHCTSQPYRFFGRTAELALLDGALDQPDTSVIALVGPGGQGKTAIVQHWLDQLAAGREGVDGIFLWSFYRGKDVDLCLRELYAFAADLAHTRDVSATYCVDHLLPLLRRQRLVLLLDGTEVVQYDSGPWFGRFIHPELGRLLEEIASAPMAGVVVLTTRFSLPELERRRHARVLGLAGLDGASARALLRGVGVRGSDADLDEAAAYAGFHAKAVELLGTLLVRFHDGDARRCRALEPRLQPAEAGTPTGEETDEEHKVARVLAGYRSSLPTEARDVLALATAFRDPPAEDRLLLYLASGPVRALLHDHWQRPYAPFQEREPGWLAGVVDELVRLRLLERVSVQPGAAGSSAVIDAHPLVRRAFESALGPAGRRQRAEARADFLHGRPDRRRAASLEEAREDIELFHAYCDAGLWEEAARVFVALEQPRYRFLAPALERDLLLRFFPHGDWRQPPLWPRFRHHRSLAICLEMLGRFEDAVDVYRGDDAPLRGDALLALGRLEPLLADVPPPPPWQVLWQAYRAHALCLAGRTAEAVGLARSLVPVDVYEWTHVFECLLRAGQLGVIDMRSFLYRPPHAAERRWAELARTRMRADYLRVTDGEGREDLRDVYTTLIEEYDRAGLPYERVLTRLSAARRLLGRNETEEAWTLNAVTLELTGRLGMRVLEADAWTVEAEVAQRRMDPTRVEWAVAQARRLRAEAGYEGQPRP